MRPGFLLEDAAAATRTESQQDPDAPEPVKKMPRKADIQTRMAVVMKDLEVRIARRRI
jgi:hypothetical protein